VFLIFSSYWQSEAYTTHIGPSDKSLFLHKPPSVESTPHLPPLFHQEDATVAFTDICMFRSSTLDHQKCSLVWYTSKHCVAHNPMLHSQNLNFVLVRFWRNIRQRIPLHCISQCLLWLVSSLFSWIMDGACLPCLAVKMLSAEVYWCAVALFVVTHLDPL
jgi:hypothetical protein